MATEVKRQREIGLCPTCCGPAIRIVGPFDSSEEAVIALKMDGNSPPKGYKWWHAYSGEITRMKGCIVQAPVERTFLYKGIPSS